MQSGFARRCNPASLVGAIFATASIAPSDRRWVSNGEVEVPPNQLREIRLTAPAAGRYKVKCTHKFHKMLGMTGTIIVR